ncbi:MAG: nitroreductase family protein, partial [Chloroflexota bacterium]
ALGLAVWAPNGGNRQSWGFYAIKNRDLVTAIADAVQAKTELIAAWPEAEGFGETVSRWRRTSDFFRSAPALIAVTMGKYESIADRVLDLRGDGDLQAVEVMAARRTGSSRLQSVAAAVTILILALHKQGLGSTWMAGPQQAKAEIEALLKVPGDMDFVALVPVGFPAETPAPGPRRPMDEVVHFLR